MILDTNALSAFAEEHPGIAAIVGEVQQIALPVIVLGEYRYGISAPRPADGQTLNPLNRNGVGWRALKPDSYSGAAR